MPHATPKTQMLIAAVIVATLIGERAAFAEAATANNNRIVGGSTVKDSNQYDFFAFWEVGCGASLIYEDILLTAAHCHQEDLLEADTVWIDSPYREQGTERRIVDRRLHPGYHPITGNNDFMVLKLNKPVTDQKPVRIASATGGDDATLQDKLKVIGFGATYEGSTTIATTLQEVTLDFVSHTSCANQYGRVGNTIDEASEFCTGITGGGKDSCQGDSGGPILNDAGVQVGVVSWGIGCARPGFSGVNARISSAYNWIQDQVCELSDNPPATCGATTTPAANTASEQDNNKDEESESFTIIVDIQYDTYPGEISWSLVRSDTPGEAVGNSLTGEESYGSRLVSRSFDGLAKGSYTFQIRDTFGDGLGPGGWFRIRNGKDTLFQSDGKFYDFVALNVRVGQTSV